MQNETLEAKQYSPKVISHQPVRFETAQSWNPGNGHDGPGDGNDGENFPPGNPNHP